MLADKKITKAGDTVKQLLIRWNGKPVEEATWEDEFVMQSEFPTLRLEDKFISPGGSIDRVTRPKVWKVYLRKNRKQGTLLIWQ